MRYWQCLLELVDSVYIIIIHFTYLVRNPRPGCRSAPLSTSSSWEQRTSLRRQRYCFGVYSFLRISFPFSFFDKKGYLLASVADRQRCSLSVTRIPHTVSLSLKKKKKSSKKTRNRASVEQREHSQSRTVTLFFVDTEYHLYISFIHIPKKHRIGIIRHCKASSSLVVLLLFQILPFRRNNKKRTAISAFTIHDKPAAIVFSC